MFHYKTSSRVSPPDRGGSLCTRYIRKVALWGVRAYQTILSPLMGPVCRFYPSCSQYAYEAIVKYGVFKGGTLAVRRILKCHPFHPGGIDLVP